jgi:hypothetical protein
MRGFDERPAGQTGAEGSSRLSARRERDQMPRKDFEDLLDSQKFEVKEVIREAGFAASDFTFDSVDSFKMHSCDVPIVSHKKTASAFAFDFEENENGDRRTRYSIRRPGREVALETMAAGSWQEQLEHFREWLSLIRREADPSGARRQLTSPRSRPVAASGVGSAVAIFISHSSADAKAAEALASLLRVALSIPASSIRCTSSLAHSLPFGVDSVETLRDEVSAAAVVVGLVTPSSTESHWVLFELGARWGLKKPLFSILARGADYGLLPAPIRRNHALKVDPAEPARVVKLVEQVAALLRLKTQASWEYEKFQEDFIAACVEPREPTPESTPGSLSALDAFKARYRYEETVCWKYDETGKRDGPYCPSCVDEGKERRLNPIPTRGMYRCVVHKGTFTTAEYRADTPGRTGGGGEYMPFG